MKYLRVIVKRNDEATDFTALVVVPEKMGRNLLGLIARGVLYDHSFSYPTDFSYQLEDSNENVIREY